ncbi:recombinase family protein [Pararhizobium sp. LjRoot255]
MSPRDIAHLLNNESVTGPRGKKWRDTAIRGHVSRGTGILNNESYIGRMVWNKRNYRKNPDTERRTARVNDANEWVLSDVPSMRIVPDELWQRVKSRQKEIGDLFDFGQSNRLNATQRPEYLLSRMLECAECGGPYAISGKDHYSCTNHRKRLPIDELGGECCRNTKTIKRQDLEERVLNCIPVAFYSLDIFDRISEKMIAHEVGMLKRAPSRKDALNAELATIKTTQKSLMQQIQDRHAEGRPRLAILDDQLDELEVTREKLVLELADAEAPAEDFQEKIANLKTQFNPANVEISIRRLLFLARNNADEHAKQRLMPIVRDLIQTVVIGKTPGHQPATLEVHGRIASVMAALDAATAMEKRFQVEKHNDYLEKLAAGELDTEQKQKKLLDAYAEELRCKYPEWENLQVSVVAGAGFEPAAFRL